MLNEKETYRYDDIIYLPHHVSDTHAHMSMYDRAAQFSPFAALTGHDEAVRETARLTESFAEIGEDAGEELNKKLSICAENLGTDSVFEFCCFVPDLKKDGGAYKSFRGSIKKLDTLNGIIILSDGTELKIKLITDISSDLFDY